MFRVEGLCFRARMWPAEIAGHIDSDRQVGECWITSFSSVSMRFYGFSSCGCCVEVVVNMIHDQTLALSGFKGFLCMGLAIRSL